MIISIDEHVNKIKVYIYMKNIAEIMLIYIFFLSVASLSVVSTADDGDLKEKNIHITY